MAERKYRIFAVVVGCLALIALGCGGSSSSNSTPSITIGALVDLSGVGSSLGNETLKAIYQAVDEAEARGVTIAVEVRDSQSDPAAAAQGAQELIDRGITTIIGPQSSSQVSQVLPIANAAGALVISTGSTASSLVIANDAVYRLVPTDKVESSAVFALMSARGRSSFVTVGRADAGNQGLINSLNGYARSAGRVTQPSVSYPTSQTAGFEGIAQQVAAAVQEASRGGASRVGVFIAGFGEVSELLSSMASNGGLEDVALYAGDGSAQVDSVISNGTSAAFASKVDALPSALTTIPRENATEALRITQAMGGTEPNAFALGAYDAVGIIERSLDIVTVQTVSGTPSLYDRFEVAANGYSGVTGTIELDAAGDRVSAPYAFWGVCVTEGGGGFGWAPVAEWVPNSPTSQTGNARYFGCP
jgi:branched-chain amino acid transport system substrate-binding protein